MLTIFHYPACSTCKKALKWLDAHDLTVERVDITVHPPKAVLLRQVRELSGLPLAKLFNTSGELYRSGQYRERLPQLSEAQAFDELAAHGKLIKRPLLVGKGVALVGFREDAYERALPLLRAAASIR